MKDISNQRFGKLIAISQAHIKNRVVYWNCICDCGREKIINGSSLRIGDIKSCGCLNKTRLLTHNMSRSSEYMAWNKMKNRCSNSNHKQYHRYGGRGITVCDRWLKFEGFFEDMGLKPSKKHSLDRIDNNKGYYKENCRWATSRTQQNNKSSNNLIFYNNCWKTISDWCRELSIPEPRTRTRLLYGYTPEQAFNPKKLKGK